MKITISVGGKFHGFYFVGFRSSIYLWITLSEFPYFRKILYKRWKTLIFNRHPNFKHLIFDLAAIILGSVSYFKNKDIYRTT